MALLNLFCREFVTTHPDMNFLGLALTDTCEKAMFTDPECPQYIPHLKVSVKPQDHAFWTPT